MTTPERLTFTPFTAADVPLLTRWLQAPHVRAFWDDGERGEAAVAANYGRPDGEMTELLMRVGGRPVGFLQTQEVGAGHEFAPWAAPTGKSWALDLLIGEATLTGRGLGPALIRAFADHWQAQRPGLRRLVIDPDERNVRARRAYEKVGFVAAGMLDEAEGGRRLILTRDLP